MRESRDDSSLILDLVTCCSMHDRPSRNSEAEPGQGRAFGALRYRDFRLLWFGAAIAHTGNWMQQVAQGWLIYELTESAFLVGLNGLLRTIPFLLMSLYAGTVADRVDRRKLLFWVEVVVLLLNAALTLIIFAGVVQVWHVYAFGIAVAMAGAFENPAQQGLLPHLVPRRDLMTAVTLNSMLRRSTQVFAPALGGLAVANLGVAMTYAIQVV